MPRLTSTDWDKACKMWASGDYTLDDLADKFDITPSALHRRFKSAGVEKGEAKETMEKAIRDSVENKARERAAELIDMISNAKELHLKGSQMISKRTLYEIKRATEEGKPLASIRDDIKTLQDAAKVLQTNYQVANQILKIDEEDVDDDTLPELTVRRMTDDDVKKLRAEQSREIDEMTSGFPGGDDIDPDDLLVEDDVAGDH